MKRLSTQILTALGFMTVLTVVGLWTAPKLIAAIKAALVQNVDEPGRNAYAESMATDCTGGLVGTCELLFSPVPNGKRLVITNVSGYFLTPPPGTAVHVILGVQNSVIEYHLPAISQGLGIGSNEYHVVNQTTLASVDQGLKPYISIRSTNFFASGGPAFTISGYTVNLP